MYSSTVQVTSRGCSRAYVLCVLWRAMVYAKSMYAKGRPISFPIADSIIEEWLECARTDCNDPDFQRVLGGIDYFPNDPSTFWTQAFHFNTWWKNNVERKEKTLSLLKDAMYYGSDEKLQARASYCKLSILLSTNIKNHSVRVLNQQLTDKRVVQIRLPPLMPSALIEPNFNNASKYVVIQDYDQYLTQKLLTCSSQLESKKVKKYTPRLSLREISKRGSVTAASTLSADQRESVVKSTRVSRGSSLNGNDLFSPLPWDYSADSRYASQQTTAATSETSSLSSEEMSSEDGYSVQSKRRGGSTRKRSRSTRQSLYSYKKKTNNTPRKIQKTNLEVSQRVFGDDDAVIVVPSNFDHTLPDDDLLSSTELHHYQQLFGQQNDPPLVHPRHTPQLTLHNMLNKAMMVDYDDDSDGLDDLRAFSPNSNHSHHIQEDRDVQADIVNAQELYSLLHSDNDAATEDGSDHNSFHEVAKNLKFVIDPIQTNWSNRPNRMGGNFDQYRNPLGSLDSLNTLTVEQPHNNTARTPSPCSTLDGISVSNFVELTVNQSTDTTLVSSATSVQSEGTPEDVEVESITPQQSITNACSILLNMGHVAASDPR